jgi:CBS domain containing-hemolysin-like protein
MYLMASFVFALVLLAFSLLGIAMRKIYYYLPAKELKRQAESGDKLARTLWRAAAYDTSLRVLLWLWIGAAAAGGFVLLARIAPWFIALIAIALALLVEFAWFPRRSRVSGTEARLAMFAGPAVAGILGYVHPFLERTLAPLARHYPREGGHTGLYESSDLLELVERQAAQADSRVSPAELERVRQALSAHRYKVRDVLTPRSEVKTLSDADTVGLVMLDELHASGQNSFLVCKGKTDKIAGTLYLQDLNLKTEGKVRDYMAADVRYLHEDDSLDQALQAFYKTKHQLFVVVNSFEEYIGVLTLEQLMQRLIGTPDPDDFDQHHDLAAVAGRHVHDDEEPPAEPVDQDDLPLPEAQPPRVSAEPEMEVVLNEDGEVESDEPEKAEAAEPAPEEPAGPNTAEPDSEAQPPLDDPDELAALDLPEDDEGARPNEGDHIDFKTPEKPKPTKSQEK